MSFSKLSRQGRAAAAQRGHQMPPLRQTRLSAAHPAWSAQCSRCHAFLSVYVNPYPNKIDIGGAAVALNCHQRIKETP